MTWLLEHIWLVPLYPLVAFFLIVAGRWVKRSSANEAEIQPLLPKYAAAGLTIGATALGLVHSLAAVQWLLSQASPVTTAIEQNWRWLAVGPLSFSLGTIIDSASVMMLFVVTFISLFIQMYTHGYMAHDKGYAKFFGYLALFNFAMLGLVLSTNLFQTYIFWELVGLCSYLLIGFWFHKKDAAEASLKAFMVNRFGDFGFLCGILILFAATAGLWIANPDMVTLSFQGLAALAPTITSILPEPWLALTCLLLFMGPVAKSAQVPLHMWLPDAMAGPTPISALIHAATMVAAGVYLLGRLFPLLEQSPITMTVITAVGLATAFIGATIALTQNDIKKALAYSTMSQLGFMVTAMGLGAYTAALFHLFTHAFFKAMLFLCSGSVIHACEEEQDMRKMGGLFGKLPVTAITYLAGTIAISGLAWSSGFWSKDEILLAAKTSDTWVYGILAFTAALTSFYMFRTFFMTFIGQYRGEAHVHGESRSMTIPLIVLMVPSLFIGWALSGVVAGWPAFANYVTLPSLLAHAQEHGHHAVSYFSEVGNTSQLLGLLGLGAAAVLYVVAPQILTWRWVQVLLAPFYSVSQNKWFFDDVLEGIVRYGYLLFAQACSVFDRVVIDGLVHGAAWSVKGSGGLLRLVQSGSAQTYIAVMVISVIVLVLLALGLA